MVTAEPLLSVRDLSVAFRQGGREMLAVDRVSFEMQGRDSGAGRRVRLRQVGDGALGDEALAVSGRQPSVRLRCVSRARNCCGLRSTRSGSVRGNDITIIFQEPMTSLNPLHTIEKQIAEILLLHQGLTGRRRARASSSC